MPNITRNAIVNCAELVTYDIIKELILKYDLMTGKAHGKIHSVRLADQQARVKIPLSVILASHQTTCPATSLPPSAQVSAQRWWRLPWMWSRHGS